MFPFGPCGDGGTGAGQRDRGDRERRVDDGADEVADPLGRRLGVMTARAAAPTSPAMPRTAASTDRGPTAAGPHPGEPAIVLIAPFGLASWFDPGVDQPNEANTMVAARTPAIVYTTPLAAHPARPSLTTPGCSATTCAVGFDTARRLDMRQDLPPRWLPECPPRQTPVATRAGRATARGFSVEAREVHPGDVPAPGLSVAPPATTTTRTCDTVIITFVLGARTGRRRRGCGGRPAVAGLGVAPPRLPRASFDEWPGTPDSRGPCVPMPHLGGPLA